MRLLVILILFASVTLSPKYASSEKATTIDELISMYNIEPCAECHEEIYEEWKSSSMGNSVVDPRVLRGWRTFIKLALDKEETLERKDLTICLNCHVPQIKDATPELVRHIADLVITAVENEDKSRREAAKKELSKLNLNCLGCHNLKATGFYIQPKEKVIYGPWSIEDSPHKGVGFDTEKSDFMETSDFCAQCHHCPPDIPWNECPTLYTTYIEDFIHKGRKETCQDCHMKGEDHKSHKFPGPKDPDFLKTAVTLTLNARVTRYIDNYTARKTPALVLKVNITNNAGHTIPHG